MERSERYFSHLPNFSLALGTSSSTRECISPISPSYKQDPVGLIPEFFHVFITFASYHILAYLDLLD